MENQTVLNSKKGRSALTYLRMRRREGNPPSKIIDFGEFERISQPTPAASPYRFVCPRRTQRFQSDEWYAESLTGRDSFTEIHYKRYQCNTKLRGAIAFRFAACEVFKRGTTNV
jgi:hypothetical protein